MKKIILMLVATMAISISGNAKTVKKTFQANGKCEMCKARIQNAAKAVAGVKTAAWNAKTQTCSVVFDNKKTSLDKIEKAVANVGHDTDKYKATDAVYNKLPGCCKYRK